MIYDLQDPNSPHSRYRRDRAFATLVDTLELLIHRAEYTPTEIREAAMLAQIHHEERNPRLTFVGQPPGSSTDWMR